MFDNTENLHNHRDCNLSFINSDQNSKIMNTDNNCYSPYIIKKTTSIISTDSKTGIFSSNNNSPHKLYTPSPGYKETLSDRYIPCKGVNLLTKFEMASSFCKQKKDKNQGCDSQLELNLNNIEAFNLYTTQNLINPISNYNSDTIATNNLPPQNSYNYNGNNQFTNEDLSNHGNYINLLQSSFLNDETYRSLVNLKLDTTIENKPIKSKIFRFKSEKNKKKSRFSIDELTEIKSNLSSNMSQISNMRKINLNPYKILEAPNLMDDFYLNLLDWSCLDYLSVGLKNSVFIWSANKSKVTKLCEYRIDNYISSVIWNTKGTHLAVGTAEGLLDIWDVEYKKKIRCLKGHTDRIGVIAWATNVVSTGSKDNNIINRDLRLSEPFFDKLYGHSHEICGLKWSFSETQLASGGNDNKLFIWNMNSNLPLAKFSNHNAAVKGIAWSPHQNNLLASAGGTADRCIRFWNTHTLQQINVIDTGSQVCNLVFSKNSNQLVSTHGYSLNQILLWDYPSMRKIATLTGHNYRVLYLGISPDGQDIVTGAGDESLRFWNVFPQKDMEKNKKLGSHLFPSNRDIR